MKNTKCPGQLSEAKSIGTCELCFKNAYRTSTGIKHLSTPKAVVEARKAAAK